MSNFDKLVANWVSAADTRPVEERAQILTNINKNLGRYRDLQNPGEAYARRQEDKRRLEEEKRREEEEEKAREKAAREACRANLPPLPPSMKKPKRPAGAAGNSKALPKGKAATKAKSAATPAADAPVVSEKERARIDAMRIEVHDVDYQFEGDVEVALRKLCDAKDKEGKESKPAASKKANKLSSPRSRKSATARPSTAVAAPAAADPYASSDGTHRNVSPLSPVPQAALGASADGPDSPQRKKPPALAMLQQDNEDADQFREESAGQQATLGGFTFGVNESSDSAADDDEQDDDGDDHIPDELDALRRADQKKRPSRMGISDAPVDIEQARIASFPPTPKSRDKVKIITKVLERHYLFSFLDDGDIAKFASIMDLERFTAGADVIVRGESNDTLFLILSGEVEATVQVVAAGEEDVLMFGQGSTFGDIGLMYDSHTSMTVRAKSDIQCASLERNTYKMIMSRAMAERRERYTGFIRSIAVFAELPPAEVSRLAEALKTSTYSEGDKIITTGTAPGAIHFIVDGSTDVRGRQGQLLATVHAGGYVGHLEFLFQHVAVADVVAATMIVKTAHLSRQQFKRLVTTAHDPMLREVEEDGSFQYYRDIMSGEDAPAKHHDSDASEEAPEYVGTSKSAAVVEDAAVVSSDCNGDGS